MFRSLLPFFLACIGFSAITLTTSSPLFEWKVSNVAADLPSAYEVISLPSPWVARFGESVNDSSYASGMISVSSNKKQCRKENLNYVASLSERDKYLDHMLLSLWKIITLPFMWGWTGVILSIIYIVWYAISSKQGVIFYSIIFAGFAVILFLNLTQILRPVAGFPFPSPYSFGTVDCNPGTITFNAILSKVHYETLVIFLIGILMEFAVLVIMFRQTRQAVERKDS